MTAAEVRGAAVGEVVAVRPIVITACARPSRATASATWAGSSASTARGTALRTVQNPQWRVQTSPSDHERRGPMLPALEDVRAARLLADGVEALPLHLLLHRAITSPVVSRILSHGGPAGPADRERAALERDSAVPRAPSAERSAHRQRARIATALPHSRPTPKARARPRPSPSRSRPNFSARRGHDRARRPASEAPCRSSRATDVMRAAAMPHGTIQREAGEIGGDVEREAVRRDPSATAHADRRDLLLADPHSGAPGRASRVKPEMPRAANQRVLEVAQVAVRSCGPRAQIDDRIADELPRAVIGHVPAAIALGDRDAAAPRLGIVDSTWSGAAPASERDDVVVLEQDQAVGALRSIRSRDGARAGARARRRTASAPPSSARRVSRARAQRPSPKSLVSSVDFTTIMNCPRRRRR